MTLDAPTVCINHPKRETAVRCNKCGRPICTQCMIQTPVGMRCRECAQLRRLPQYEVDTMLLARSALVGLAVSLIAWLVIDVVPYLRFFLAILVGVAVGEVMSRLARRRVNRVLEATAVLNILIGAVVANLVYGSNVRVLAAAIAGSPYFLMSVLLPVVVASVVAVLKLR